MLDGKTPAVDGPRGGRAFGDVHVVAVGIKAARVLADRVHALDDLAFQGQGLEVFIDARAAHGRIRAQRSLDRVEAQ